MIMPINTDASTTNTKLKNSQKKRYLPDFAKYNTKCAYLSHWYVYVDVIHIAYVNYIIHCNRALSRIQIKGRKTGERQCRCIQRNPNVFSSEDYLSPHVSPNLHPAGHIFDQFRNIFPFLSGCGIHSFVRTLHRGTFSTEGTFFNRPLQQHEFLRYLFGRRF